MGLYALVCDLSGYVEAAAIEACHTSYKDGTIGFICARSRDIHSSQDLGREEGYRSVKKVGLQFQLVVLRGQPAIFTYCCTVIVPKEDQNERFVEA